MSAVATPLFIIGAQKSGTSSLHHYLAQCKEICSASEKELHFFDFKYKSGIASFLAEFSCRNASYFLDSSPFYLFHPQVAERIYRYFPKAKFIVLLRNPAERAVSHYQMNKKRSVEMLSLKDALLQEPLRLQNPQWDMPESDVQNFSYLERGKYYKQLELWFRCFPREHFFLVESQYFFEEEKQVLKSLSEFLEISLALESLDLQAQNKGAYDTLNLAADISSFLKHYYEPHNTLLIKNLKLDAGKINW